MLNEFILDWFFDFAFMILSVLPRLDFAPFANTVGAFETFLSYAAYFLPMDTIFLLFSIIVAEESFKIVLSFLKMAFKLLPIPFVG